MLDKETCINYLLHNKNLSYFWVFCQCFYYYMRCVWKVTGLCSVNCAHCTKNFYRREESIAFCDVTMSYGFENQISAFGDNYIIFCTFFCQGTFFVTVLWKFYKLVAFFFSLVWRMSIEQQVNLKFLVHLGKTPTEALKLLKMITGVGGHLQAEQKKMFSV